MVCWEDYDREMSALYFSNNTARAVQRTSTTQKFGLETIDDLLGLRTLVLSLW
jgi:hypothetical protein